MLLVIGVFLQHLGSCCLQRWKGLRVVDTVVDNQRQQFLYLGNTNFLEETKDRFELGWLNNV